MKKFVCLVGIALAAFTLSSCGGNETTSKTVADSTYLIDTAIVHSGVMPNKETFTATVDAKITNNIAPQQPLRINRMMVEVGDRVARNQIVARLDDAMLTQLKVQLENSKANFDRIDELYKIGGISKQQWDQAKLALDVVQSQHDNMSENTVLRSPSPGIVTVRNYDNGDMYSPSMPLYTIEDISSVKLKLNISEQYYSQVKLNMPVEVTVDALSGDIYEGRITLVHPSINPNSHTFVVEVTVPNSKAELRSGMYARANINFGMRDVIMVSDRAVTKQAGSNERFVYVVKGDTVEKRFVEVAGQKGAKVIVVGGLESEEVVVTSGTTLLQDGAIVRINTKNTAK